MTAKKTVSIAATLIAISLSLAACSSKSGSKNDQQVLNWSEATELSSIDPSKATDSESFDMLGNSMEGLYRLGKNSKVEPGIARSTKISKNKLHYTFTLRKGAKWSNGDEVTAKDFVYSWKRTIDPKTGSSYSYLFDGVANSNDIINGKKSPTTLGIKADGKYKLSVTLDKQVPYFKLLMGFPVFFPQNEKTVKKYGSNYGTESKYMVYNGPFVMKNWTGSNLSWKFKKNNDYWDKKNVKLSGINFKVNKSPSTAYNLYQSGKSDMSQLSTEQARQLNKKPGFTVEKSGQMTYLEFNQKQAAFKNTKIRQALSLAINRKQLAGKIMGEGTEIPTGIVPNGLAKNNGTDFSKEAKTDDLRYSESEAKRLFNEGLAEIGQSKLRFTLLGADTDQSKDVTAYIQSQLEQHLGSDKIRVDVSNVPLKTRLSRSRAGNFDVVAANWVADYTDPISFMELFTTGNEYNDGSWSNSQYDELIKAAKTTDAADPDKRWNDMVKASKILSKDMGVSPLYQQNSPEMIRPKVKGLIVNSAGVMYNYKNVHIEE
ncbi:peptide ABC transporter substrate-binding protein [Ligilactobacillus acidipiscis]|uniref:Oligopeptide ABC transporter, periplasmic oligopeptide-binding protein OppA (TC 3.A.1.5.1) n=1 Tax=Ligilactobacillus acidipiscis TaxID=89059 RepID=A0A1K1KLI3_9LACO|nr:peptide ABC transporter substrate-binding protein [Ligilactobacillus acidipiscis]SFV39749.1 Oligopeptide ABC transporter, periplasmic oligopeptide-binding protein OppA (TC 3.A.1.5.1) [Ligilactobacillus acidipiscis]